MTGAMGAGERLYPSECHLRQTGHAEQTERKSKDNRYTNINMKLIYFLGGGGLGMSAF